MRFSSYISFYKNPKPAKTKILIVDSDIRKTLVVLLAQSHNQFDSRVFCFLGSRMNLILNFIDVFFVCTCTCPIHTRC
jgi:hypothetical protein